MIVTPNDIRSIQCNDTYFPILDGVVRVIHNYATIMNAISGCTVVCPSQKEYFDDSSLPYEVIRCASLKLPAMNYGVAVPMDPLCMRKMLSVKAEIAHVHSPFMAGMTVMAAAKIKKIPVVMTFHSKYYSDMLQVTKSPFIAQTITNMIISLYNRCDEVWACSEGAKETLRSYGYKKKITVMPNGCDMKEPDNIADLRERAKSEFGLTPDKKTILFTGSMIWQKNLKLILDTFRVLEKVRPGEFRLVLAGTGNHEKEIRAYAKKICPESADVLFTGGIYDRDLLSGVYSQADLFFFPSVYDTDGLVLKEAAAMKTPALATRGSSASGVIVPEVNGFVAEENARAMAKKIIEVTKDPKVLASAGEAAAKTIPVPWEKIVERVYEEYARIIRDYR